MTKREINKFIMYKSLMTVLDQNREKIKEIEGIKTIAEELAGAISGISETDTRFKSLSKGAASVKYSSKDSLISAVLKTGNVLYVYAKRAGNLPLKEKSELTESGLKRLRDSELLQTVKIIIENAEQTAAEISSFHKTFNDELKNLKEQFTAFEGSINNLSSKSTEKQATREALTEAFKKADDIIKKQLDPFIELIREKEVNLYNQYYAARTIKDLGVRKVKAEGEEKKEDEAKETVEEKV